MNKLKRLYVKLRIAKAETMIIKLTNKLGKTYVKNNPKKSVEIDIEIFSWKKYKNELEQWLEEN